MASNSEEKEILEAAVAGVPRVAEAVALIPEEDRAKALEAAEGAYRQTVRDLGYEQGPAEDWVSAIMLQLRTELEQQVSAQKSTEPSLVPTEFDPESNVVEIGESRKP